MFLLSHDLPPGFGPGKYFLISIYFHSNKGESFVPLTQEASFLSRNKHKHPLYLK